jgi:hypothetical protein
MQTTYRAGHWYLVVVPGAVVALPPDVADDAVTRLWRRMPEEPTLATVLDVLAAGSGGGFSSLPPFAAVVAEGSGIRVAVRGDVAVRALSPTGSEELTGAELTTWSERLVADAGRVEIALGGDAETPEGVGALAVRDGIVRASSAVSSFDSDDVMVTAGPATHPERVDEELLEHVRQQGDADGTAEPTGVPEEADAAETADAMDADDATAGTADAGEPAMVSDEAVDEATMVPSEVTLAPSSEDFDQLWGATVHSPPVPTAPAAPPAQALPSASAAGPEAHLVGDHDGATISVAELRAMRQQNTATGDVPTAVLPAVPETTGTSARIRVSTGQVVTLDRTVIIGRRPRSTRASGATMPHLVAVDSPQQDISRSHLEIRPEGDTVVVIDLHTTNGSTLLRSGADPVRLHPGEQTLVLSGDVIDLGDGVEVAFEDLP